MNKNTEQFQWTDELAQDYIHFYAASYAASVAYFNPNETLEKFKQSKSKKAPKEEQVPIKVKKKIIAFGRQRDSNGFWYEFYSQHPIPTEKYQSIKEAIEGVLNGKTEYGLLVATGNIESFNKGYSIGYKDANKYNDKKYTESELLQARRDAFSHARVEDYQRAHIGEIEFNDGDSRKLHPHKYPTFEDYINSLNK